MTRRAIVINSQSTGKFVTQDINGRPHIVTTMVSIEGDSVMNSLFYPAHEVAAAHGQLDRLPAPASHPVVNGAFVSASDPLATNAFNVGGVVLNPRMSGPQVINDLAFDVEVAERDPRGVEILDRIRNGKSIGVSTGLNADLLNVAGEFQGREYTGIISGIEFDHVATLLDEMPAGDNTYTLNSSEPDKVIVCTLDSPNDAGGVVFTGEGGIVERKVSYEPVTNSAPEGDSMDLEKFVMMFVANASNSFTPADVVRLAAMTEVELANALSAGAIAPEITVEQATALLHENGLTVNSDEFDADGYAEFVAKGEQFKAFQDALAEDRQKLVDSIVANSKTTAEDLGGFDMDGLQRMAESLVPAQDFSALGALTTNADSAARTVDYS